MGRPHSALRDLPEHGSAYRRDFNVRLTPEDRPNDMGGQDPGSAHFRETLAHLGLGEMGPIEQRFTWHGPTTQSKIDRF